MAGPGQDLGRWSLAMAAIVGGCTLQPVPGPPAPPPLAPARPAPAPPPGTEIISDCGIGRLRDTVLRQVNAARATARSCGAKKMQPARALEWNRALAEAAEQHSVDMAARRYFNHVNPEGRRVSERVTAQGYKWRMVGENLAGGDSTVSGVISGWLKRPDDCLNMMSPAYAEIGVSCVRQPGSQWETYWTMVLATKR